MKTEELIRVLSADVVAEPPISRPLWAGLAPALAIGLTGLLLTIGARPDLAATIWNPMSVLRFVLSIGLGLAALRLAQSEARPTARNTSLGRALAPVLAVVLVALGLWLWTWIGTPAEGRGMAIVGKTAVSCLLTIPALSILPVAAILVALKQGAPTRPVLAGLAAGLAGGGLAAAIYALHCTEDSPLFYVTWYGTAILIVTGITAILAQRVLRW